MCSIAGAHGGCRCPECMILGAFLAFAKVLKPRRKDAHHERAGEDVKIMAGGPLRGAKRAGKLRCIPCLPMIVGYHRPETAQGFRRDGNAELWNVAFEKGAEKILTPGHARSIVSGQIGPGEPSAYQQAITLGCAQFGESEAGNV